MDKKGQALIEFVIILPILIFILFAIIDFGIINYNRSTMESLVNDIKLMYNNNESNESINTFINENIKGVIINIKEDNSYLNIDLKKEYKFITPGLDKILNNYEIEVERKVYNEVK